MSAMDEVLDIFQEQGWTIAKREPVGGSRSPNPTRVDVIISRKQQLFLTLYAWKVTGEGKGRVGTNFRIQTTRSHQEPLLTEPDRLTLGFGIDKERGVLAVFDGWTKRNTGSSSSVHIKRALLDQAAADGFATDGPRWDSRAACSTTSPSLLLPWIHEQQQRRTAPVTPLSYDVHEDTATVVADLWDSAPAAWLRENDDLVLTDRDGTGLADKSIWRVSALDVHVSTPGRNPRRSVTFQLRRYGRISETVETTLLATLSRRQP